MSKVNVTRNEFKNSFKSHYKLYNESDGSDAHNSRCLLLFYSVECGLKSLVLKKIGGNTYMDLEKYRNNAGKNGFGHNIRELAKEMDIDQVYPLKRIRLKNGGNISSEQFNELWRYGAEIEDETEGQNAEETLKKIADWIIVRL